MSFDRSSIHIDLVNHYTIRINSRHHSLCMYEILFKTLSLLLMSIKSISHLQLSKDNLPLQKQLAQSLDQQFHGYAHREQTHQLFQMDLSLLRDRSLDNQHHFHAELNRHHRQSPYNRQIWEKNIFHKFIRFVNQTLHRKEGFSDMLQYVIKNINIFLRHIPFFSH